MSFHFNLPRVPDFVDFTPGFISFPGAIAPQPPAFPNGRRTKDFGSSAFVFDPKAPVFQIPGVPRGPVTNPFGIPGFGAGTRAIPQASDDVFRGAVANRAFNIGGLLIFGLDIFIRAANKAQQRRIDDDFESLEELERRRQRVRNRDRAIETIPESRMSPPPGGFPGEPQQPFIVFPPITVPAANPVAPPSRVPDAQPQPVTPLEIGFPAPGFETLPGPLRSPAPVEIPTPRQTPIALPTEFPNPGQFELENPVPAPDRLLFPFESPFNSPFGDPLTQPIGDPLTGTEPRSVPSDVADPFTQPGTDFGTDTRTGTEPRFVTSPQAQTDPSLDARNCRPKTCEEDLEEPRVECFKGLYREGVLDTDFTAWQQIDCLTGREI